MNRTFFSKLQQWSDKKNRKPLLIRGARQVGKTYAIRQLGNSAFAGSFIEINLERNPDWHPIFQKNRDIKRILMELELVSNTIIDQEKSLLFIDEIQACPDAINTLRYFYEETPNLRVIAAGSLLEFALHDIPFPVGRIELLTMYPMTFTEFLWALNKENLANFINKHHAEISETIHQQISQQLRLYFFVGGMPECVKVFTETNNMNAVSSIQKDLINTYQQDFIKYTPKVDTHCLHNVFSNLTQQIGQQIKYSKLSEGFTNPTIKKAFHLLETARLITKIKASSPAGLPLNAHSRENTFKAIFIDIGLLCQVSGLNVGFEYQKSDLLAVFAGALAEQFVGQELLAAEHELFYWSRNAKSSSAETDYLITAGKEIVPIEVKNGAKGRLRRLHVLFNEYPNIKQAVVLNDAPLLNDQSDKITYLPLYLAGYVKEYL